MLSMLRLIRPPAIPLMIVGVLFVAPGWAVSAFGDALPPAAVPPDTGPLADACSDRHARPLAQLHQVLTSEIDRLGAEYQNMLADVAFAKEHRDRLRDE